MSFYHDELSWSWDSAARETAQDTRDDRDMQDWEPELERARHHTMGPESYHGLGGRRFWIHWSLDRFKLIRSFNERYERENPSCCRV